MPLSAVVVQQLLANQDRGHAQRAAYAQQIQQQNPLQALEMRTMQGDPTQQRSVAAATGVAKTGAGVAGGAATAIGLGAAFGLAPRYLDPFTGSMHGAAMAHRSGGMLAAAGAGLGVAGAYFAVGQAASFVTKNVIQGIQEQTHAQGMLQQNWKQSGMNMDMSLSNTNQMASSILGISRAAGYGYAGQRASPGQMTNMVSTGMQSGRFRGVDSVKKFKRVLNRYTNEASQMAGLLRTSIDEAATQMEQLSGNLGIGFKGTTGVVQRMQSQIGVTGMGMGQQMQIAGVGRNAFQGLGLSRGAGSMYGLNLAGRVGAGLTSGSLSRAHIADMGGATAAASRFTQAGFRGLGGRYGKHILGAMMTESGEIDANTARQIASGAMTKREIMKLSRQNVRGRAGRQMFGAHREEMMGEFMSQHGPEGVMGALGSMTAGKGNQDYLLRRATGLGMRDLDQMQSMSANSNQIKAKISQAAREGFEAGRGPRSVSDLMSSAVNQLVGPIKGYFKEIGRSMTLGITESLDAIQRDISGKGPARGPMDKSMSSNFAAIQAGFGETVDLRDADPISRGTGHLGLAPTSTFLGGAARGMMPAAFGHLRQGGRMSELSSPLHSLLPTPFGKGGGDWLSGRNVATAGVLGEATFGLAGFATGTRSPIGWAGSRLTAGGKALADTGMYKGLKMSGFFGIGGSGAKGAALRSARWGMAGAGAAMRGVGALSVARAANPLALAATELALRAPDMMRWGGMMGADEGWSGPTARASAAMARAGVGGTSPIVATGNMAEMKAMGYTPIVGETTGGLSGGGRNSLWDIMTGGLWREGANVQQQYGQTQQAEIQREALQQNSLGAIMRKHNLTSTGMDTMLRGAMVDFKEAQVAANNPFMDYANRNKVGHESLQRFRASLPKEFQGDSEAAMYNMAAAAGVTSARREVSRMGRGPVYVPGMSEATIRKTAAEQARESIRTVASRTGVLREETILKTRLRGLRNASATRDRGLSRGGGGYLSSKSVARRDNIRKTEEALNKIAPGAAAMEKMVGQIEDISIDYIQGLAGSRDGDLHGLVNQNQEQLGAYRRHVISEISKLSSDGTRDANELGAEQLLAGDNAFNMIRGAASIHNTQIRGAAAAKIIREHINKPGRDFKSSMANTEYMLEDLEGGSEIAGHLEDMADRWANASPNSKEGLMAGDVQRGLIRESLFNMDREDAIKLAQRSQQMYDKTGNAIWGELANKARGVTSFRGAMQKQLKRPGVLKNKMAIAAEVYGGSQEVKEIFGIGRGGTKAERARRKIIRESVQKLGRLPAAQQEQLKRTVAQQLMFSNDYGKDQAIRIATGMTADMDVLLDPDGFTEDDIKGTKSIQEAIQTLSGRGRGRKRDSSQNDMEEATRKFIGQLGKLESAMSRVTKNTEDKTPTNTTAEPTGGEFFTTDLESSGRWWANLLGLGGK